MKRWSIASAVLSLCLTAACDDASKEAKPDPAAKFPPQSAEAADAKTPAKASPIEEVKPADGKAPPSEAPPEMPGPGSEAHVGKVGVGKVEGTPRRVELPAGGPSPKRAPAAAKH